MSEKKIQSLERAIKIIECFSNLNVELTLNEISEMVGLNKSTTHGILKTMSAYSYINQSEETRKYKLGIKFLEKGNLVSACLDLKSIGQPYLNYITDKFRETPHISQYLNGEVYCISKLQPPHGYLFTSSFIGRTLPFHATASGKIILAHFSPEKIDETLNNKPLQKLTDNTITNKNLLKKALSEIREQGYSIEDEEAEIGAYSIAAPIMNYMGNVVGSISILGPPPRIKENLLEISRELQKAAFDISAKLGNKKL